MTEQIPLDPSAVLPGGAGVAISVEPEIVDYFAFSDLHTWFFPDKRQWIKFKVMTEGDKAKFQRLTNRDIKVNQRTQDATVKMDVAQERHTLIKESVVDWFVFAMSPVTGKMEQVPFSLSGNGGGTGMNLEKFLSAANPKIVEDLEYAIRMANPWLQSDMTIEEIDKEIERLQEMRDTKEREQAGNSSSGSR